MSLIHRLIRHLVSIYAPKDNLKRELFYLERNMRRVKRAIDICNKRLNEGLCGEDFEFCQFQLYNLENKYTRQFRLCCYLEYKLAQKRMEKI